MTHKPPLRVSSPASDPTPVPVVVDAEPRPTEGFDRFYATAYPSAVRLALVLTGDRAAAEDVAQEAFVSAYRHWPKVSGYESPEGWLHRVVTNRCISRSRWVRSQSSLFERLRPGAAAARDDADPTEAEAVLAQIRRLPRRQAQVMALVVLGDRTPADIAAVLGCGEASVRTHLARARATLAQRLASDEPDSIPTTTDPRTTDHEGGPDHGPR